MTEDGDGEIVTFRLAPRDRAAIKRLVETGEFRNRSDFLRYAVKNGLRAFGPPERPNIELDLEDYSLTQPEPAPAKRSARNRKEMHRP